MSRIMILLQIISLCDKLIFLLVLIIVIEIIVGTWHRVHSTFISLPFKLVYLHNDIKLW